jgi:positive regulator of sigma E activity
MDKAVLQKGLMIWLRALLFMALGPVVLSSAFKNQSHSLFIPVLISGIVLSLLAIYFGFKAIKKMMEGLFSDKS